MTDVTVIGAGPAGIAAAVHCAENGRSVTLIDDNPTIGGQIWRGGSALTRDPTASKWFQRLQSCTRVTFLNGRVIAADSARRQLAIESLDNSCTLTWRTLILATGARELFLPFPGWTLPGVTGVGGLQALVKSGLPIANKRIVVAGSGPLLLAAAAYFKKHGAIVCTIAEQAPWQRLARFGLGLFRSPAKLFQAIHLRAALRGVSYRSGSWVTRAEGDQRIERVYITNGRRTWSEACDYATVAYGLWPSTELASLLGCRLQGNTVTVDEYGRTSIPDVFCAGEATGIGGLELSLVEGEIAGYSAVGKFASTAPLLRRRNTSMRFARHLEHSFALRSEIRNLSDPSVIVCRCEDVRFERLKESSSWREAKLHTRCGMGPCQGRVCGPALNVLLGWQTSSIRPPILPARLDALLNKTTSQQETITPI